VVLDPEALQLGDDVADSPLRVPRVALVTPSLMRGGLEALVCQLAEAIMSQGDFKPIVYAAYAGGPYSGLLANRGCRYRVLFDFEVVKARIRKATRLPGTERDWYAAASEGVIPRTPLSTSCFAAAADLVVLPRLVAAIRQDSIDIVHGHGLSIAFLTGTAGKLSGRPSVLTSHNEGYALGRFPDRVRRRFAGWAIDEGTGVSHDASVYLATELAWSVDRVATIPNGIAAPALTAIPPADSCGRVIGIAGNLHSLKGHRVLFHAFQRLRASSGTARLLVIGDGPERTTLESLARRLGIRAAVDFLGAYDGVSDPAYVDFLTRANVIALPSFAEASPMVVLEAMAAGRPVVAFNVGGVSDIIHNGVNGLLVAPGEVDALAHALLELLGDPARRRRMGAAGRETHGQSLTVGAMVARYGAIYSSAIG
jgi:glycosyltransferase involved in cell wall biosynthesis